MLTTAQVAKRWGCNQKWVQYLIKEGRLAATLFGRVYQVAESDADAFEHRPAGRPASNGHTKAATQKRAKRSKKAPRAKAG